MATRKSKSTTAKSKIKIAKTRLISRNRGVVNLRSLLSGKATLGHNSGSVGRLSIFNMKPTVSNKSLLIQSNVISSVPRASPYLAQMMFYGVDYSDKHDNSHPLTVSLGNGQYLFMNQLRLDSKVSVRCNCQDYRFTWGHYNHTVGALLGAQFPRYVRKTTTRPPRNPLQIPGLCKHLTALVNRLAVDRIVVK